MTRREIQARIRGIHEGCPMQSLQITREQLTKLADDLQGDVDAEGPAAPRPPQPQSPIAGTPAPAAKLPPTPELRHDDAAKP